jgi:hypothetical protein
MANRDVDNTCFLASSLDAACRHQSLSNSLAYTKFQKNNFIRSLRQTERSEGIFEFFEYRKNPLAQCGPKNTFILILETEKSAASDFEYFDCVAMLF